MNWLRRLLYNFLAPMLVNQDRIESRAPSMDADLFIKQNERQTEALEKIAEAILKYPRRL